MSDGGAFTLFLLLLLLVALVVQSRRRQAVRAQLRQDAEFAARRQEALHTRPADLAVEILGRHMPTLLAKAEPHIARDAYGVLTISPEFDGEIRYFVERVVLSDPAYLRAAQDVINIDANARGRLLDSSAVLERLVRTTILGAWQDRSRRPQGPQLPPGRLWPP
jgi:hypothetical protein